MENNRTVQSPISRLNLFLTGSGLFFFLVGSYMSLGVYSNLLNPGQYLLILGVVLSCVAMILIFRKQDF